MFNINEYLNDLVVEQDDEELARATDLVDLIQLISDDPWLSRQAHFGLAGAMERQIEYLGSTLLPNTVSRIRAAKAEGVATETYTQDSWFGSSNVDDPHINDENPEQKVTDNEMFRDQLEVRMRTAAIMFATNMRAHNDISVDLNQLSYGQIKAKAEANRLARSDYGKPKTNVKSRGKPKTNVKSRARKRKVA